MALVLSSNVLQHIYAVSLNLVRKRVINNIEDGDVALQQIKDQITNEFEVINRKLDRLLNSHLKAAEIHLQKALTALEFGSFEEAKNDFETCCKEAVLAFANCEKFTDKAKAIRYELMSILALNNYFYGECKRDKLERQCRDTVNRLLLEVAVRSAIRDEFETVFFSFSSKSVRREVFDELASLLEFIVGSINIKFDLKQSNGSIVELRNIKPRVRRGHTSIVTSIIIYEDKIYTGSEDDSIKVWDLLTLTEITTLKGHTSYVLCLAISNNRLYSGSDDKSIKEWNMTNNTLIDTIEVGSWVASIVIFGNRLYAGCADGNINIYDISTSQYNKVGTFSGHTRWVCCLAVSNNRLYSGSHDMTIKVWDLLTNSDLYTLRGHSNFMRCLVLYNGKLCSGSRDSTIKVWDIQTFDVVTTLEGHTWDVNCLAISGSRLYSGSGDKTIKVWDLLTNSELYTVSYDSEVNCIAVSGGKLYSGHCNGSLLCRYL